MSIPAFEDLLIIRLEQVDEIAKGFEFVRGLRRRLTPFRQIMFRMYLFLKIGSRDHLE